MDQLRYASLSHTHYWYEVGMLKVPATDVSVQYNGGLLADIILLTQCYYHRGTSLNAMQEVLYLQPMIPPKRFDIFPPDWGMLRRSRRVLIFLLTTTQRCLTGNLLSQPCRSNAIQCSDMFDRGAPGSQPGRSNAIIDYFVCRAQADSYS